MEEVTHRQLVDAAVRWARGTKKCTVVLAEFSAERLGGSPDVFASHSTQGTILVECKRSLADFRADASKAWVTSDAVPGERRWYLVPTGLLPEDYVPKGWGLLELRKGRVFSVVEAPRHDLTLAGALTEREIFRKASARHEFGDTFDPSTGRFIPFQGVAPDTTQRTKAIRDHYKLAEANMVASATCAALLVSLGEELDPELREALSMVGRRLASRGGAHFGPHRGAGENWDGWNHVLGRLARLPNMLSCTFTREVIECPGCGVPHVDEGEWARRLHHTHLCLSCGARWRLPRYVFGVAP